MIGGATVVPDYYNTNKVAGETLANAQIAAKGQEEAVLKFFRSRAGHLLTPEDALTVLHQNTPLTSVRRAITNLTIKGWLTKTETMKLGRYGKPIHYWTYAPKAAA